MEKYKGTCTHFLESTTYGLATQIKILYNRCKETVAICTRKQIVIYVNMT